MSVTAARIIILLPIGNHFMKCCLNLLSFVLKVILHRGRSLDPKIYMDCSLPYGDKAKRRRWTVTSKPDSSTKLIYQSRFMLQNWIFTEQLIGEPASYEWPTSGLKQLWRCWRFANFREFWLFRVICRYTTATFCEEQLQRFEYYQ